MQGKLGWVTGMAVALSSCGGGTDPLAQLCLDEAAKRLDGQVYRLDEKKLAKSKVMAEDGNAVFTAEIILKPGTSGETMQTLDCAVAPPSGDAPGRVMRLRFDVTGSGLTK